MRFFFLCAGLILVSFDLHATASIEASGELAADAIDPLGDTVGGIGSGLVYDSQNDVYLCQPDRGPGDGSLPFRPRFVVVKIKQSGETLEPTVVESVIFRDAQDVAMTGLTPDDFTADAPRMKDGRTCLDPEAIALAADGTLYVSDEYGPLIYQFARDGRMIRRIKLPKKFDPRNSDGALDFAGIKPLVSGRNVNQGGEGMALMPDGKSLAIIFQSGLVEDGGHNSLTTRIVIVSLETGEALAEYVYPFATVNPTSGEALKVENLSVNDLVVLDEQRFLVLERDRFGRDGSLEPTKAAYKAVWLADASKATDLLHRKTPELIPVEKVLLYNLPALVKNPAELSAKWEGIALIPPSDEKAVTIIMAADNDFLTPLIHDEGRNYPFPRVEAPVPTQFFKIRAGIPELGKN